MSYKWSPSSVLLRITANFKIFLFAKRFSFGFPELQIGPIFSSLSLPPPVHSQLASEQIKSEICQIYLLQIKQMIDKSLTDNNTFVVVEK